MSLGFIEKFYIQLTVFEIFSGFSFDFAKTPVKFIFFLVL